MKNENLLMQGLKNTAAALANPAKPSPASDKRARLQSFSAYSRTLVLTGKNLKQHKF
ncbi:hypothetical protein NP603_19100 [Methylomonas sp. SURF-1]|uniref:Uncharacterized protein n=1 Tax=Methylomonas aurea TaxID=2952224 RepID=A0ABT1UNF4_9GAMM|nr:hypothetical protein [Methylomonas sp. SURF-1]MCQ8183229.1 hypothetical protein [Methylomonas sp. SURF-1]